eukprot:TRINITY_DN191_c5_g1_i1.p1 TRINITY_DN191_c5_g1~~TRINITY_DN191_c5_g1_i1.p1  ORF type:complete len:1046 (+),score=115.32 TRINITY_DN191_c5_g1_i1:52-3189(+)
MEVNLVNESFEGPLAVCSGRFLEGRKGACIATLQSSGKMKVFEELSPSEGVEIFEVPVTSSNVLIQPYPSQKALSDHLLMCDLQTNVLVLLSGTDFLPIIQLSGGCSERSPSCCLPPFTLGGCGPHSKVIVTFPDEFSIKTTVITGSDPLVVRSEKTRRLPPNIKLLQVVPLHTRDCSRRLMVAALTVHSSIEDDPYPLTSIETFSFGKGDTLEPGPWNLRNIYDCHKGLILMHITEVPVVQEDPMLWPSCESLVDPILLVSHNRVQLYSSRGLECVAEPPTGHQPLQVVRSMFGVSVEQGRVAKSRRCWKFVTLTADSLYSFIVEDCLTADKKPRRYFTIEVDNNDLTTTTKTRQKNDLSLFSGKHTSTELFTTSSGIGAFCPDLGVVLHGTYSTQIMSSSTSIHPAGRPVCLSEHDLLFPSGCRVQSVNQFSMQCQLVQSPDLESPASLHHAAEVFFVSPTPVAIIAFEGGASIIDTGSLEFCSSEHLEHAQVRSVSDVVNIGSGCGYFVVCTTERLLVCQTSKNNPFSVIESVSVDLELCDTHACDHDGSIVIVATKGNLISKFILTADDGKVGIDGTGQQQTDSSTASICIDHSNKSSIYYSLWDTDSVYWSSFNKLVLCNVGTTARSLTCVSNSRILAWCVSGHVQVISNNGSEMVVQQTFIQPSIPNLRFAKLQNDVVCCGTTVLAPINDLSFSQHQFCIPESSSKIRSISAQRPSNNVIWIDSAYDMFLGSVAPLRWVLKEHSSPSDRPYKVTTISVLTPNVVACLCVGFNTHFVRIEHMAKEKFELCSELLVHESSQEDSVDSTMMSCCTSETDSVVESKINIVISTYKSALIQLSLSISLFGDDLPAVSLESSNIYDLGSHSSATITMLAPHNVIVSTNFGDGPSLSVLCDDCISGTVSIPSNCLELQALKGCPFIICLTQEGVELVSCCWPRLSLCCRVDLTASASLVISESRVLLSVTCDGGSKVLCYEIDEGNSVPTMNNQEERSYQYSNSKKLVEVSSQKAPFAAAHLVNIPNCSNRFIGVGAWGMFYINLW